MLLVKPRGPNQNDRQATTMWDETATGDEPFSLRLVVNDVVGRQPEFAQPNVEKKNGEEASEIENVFFQGHCPAERGSRIFPGSRRGLDSRRTTAQNKIEQAPQGDKDGQGPIKSALRDVQSLAGQEPSGDQRAGNDKEQKAEGVPVRGGVLVDRHERVQAGGQCGE